NQTAPTEKSSPAQLASNIDRVSFTKKGTSKNLAYILPPR
ncbi:MAG: hypothetical protein ACI9WR_001274, partial [Paracoccaceae bacterium]